VKVTEHPWKSPSVSDFWKPRIAQYGEYEAHQIMQKVLPDREYTVLTMMKWLRTSETRIRTALGRLRKEGKIVWVDSDAGLFAVLEATQRRLFDEPDHSE